MSSSGDDSKSGTSPSEAWRSLNKVNSFTPKPGDQVLFSRGDHWVGTLTVNGSGTAGSPVVYGAYGTGEDPKIYASEEITGWTKHSGNIYKATFGKEIKQIFIDGNRAKLARYPNSGYLSVTSVLGSTKFSSSGLNSGINYTGAAWVGRSTAFTIYSKTVTASSSQTLTINSAPYGSLGAGEGFFLADKLEFLDSPGEWYYDAASGTVYLWTPSGDSPGNHTIRGAILDNGINISSKNYVKVENLAILHSSTDAIYINNGDYITIHNNNIVAPDEHGIHIPSGGSSATTITNNKIYNANTNGIRLYSNSSVISDNLVQGTGLLDNINKTATAGDNFGSGMYLRGNDIKTTYNRIINSGYNGINWKGQNCLISYNYINGACQVLDDGAGIYTYNGSNYSAPGSKGSEVLHNIILNVHGNSEGFTHSYNTGYGIYMDNNTHHIQIKNNLVSGASSGICLHDAGAIEVSNNTVMDALLAVRISGVKAVNTIQNNLFYLTNRTGNFVWWKNSHQHMIFKMESSVSCDYNTYIDHYESAPFSHGGGDRTFDQWKSLTKKDTHSTFDNSPLAKGETEELFYNDTKQAKTITLEKTIYKDLDGKQVSGSITLQPFTSKILIKTTSENTNTNQSPVIQG
ncbi:MAG: right-handed parallel beta-helix repeat-containing protein, partial [Prolixibacteraceae bacterium]|nr:right-handed parallel beta-helix repeat-containing protein [Prolixibacteraceae bacterium]